MRVLEMINGFVWGIPALLLILLVGIVMSVGTGFVQIRRFPEAWKRFCSALSRKQDTGRSGYRALCTALAATVGTGNLAGVAGAIAIGGPGAVFWMWVCGVLGMATKFAEAVLAVRYRKKSRGCAPMGGPMYIITGGLSPKWHFLAGIYCFFGVVASFGVGNATQINTVMAALQGASETLGMPLPGIWKLILGLGLGGLIVALLSGGGKRIGAAAESIVPAAALGYLVISIGVLLLRIRAVPAAFAAILKGAFSPSAVTGGAVGSFFTALRIGAARGVFTNEAGMGTAAIAHGSAEVSHPVEQGLMGIVEVFLDTIVICTFTALVILCSGVPVGYGKDAGIDLTAQAFSSVLGSWVQIPLAIAICLFAVATVMGWGFYGIRCAEYLFGERAIRGFVLLQGGTAVLGTLLGTGTVWILSDIVNALMAIPNLFALVALAPEVFRLLRGYRSGYDSVTESAAES